MKKTIIYKVVLCIIFLMAFGQRSAGAPVNHRQYGLHISSFPDPLEERTSLLLDKGEPIRLDGHTLHLSFRVKVHPENILGTLCRVIGDNGTNVDIMFAVEQTEERFPMLVVGDRTFLLPQSPIVDVWTEVSLSLDPRSGEVEMRYGEDFIEVEYPALSNTNSVRISLGRCIIPGYELSDIASVDFKDVELRHDDRLTRRWQLKAHVADTCFDEINHSPAVATNPIWLIDSIATWKKIFSGDFKGLPSFAFDPVIATFYIVEPQSSKLLVFHTFENITDTIDTRKRGNKPHLANYPNQMIYIDSLHRLITYNLEERHFAHFDPVDQIWEGDTQPPADHNLWNNSVVYNRADSSLISFGGYGHYRYNSMLLKSYPFACLKQNERTDLPAINPRRSSSTAIVGDTLYIFGGWGSPSGRQEVGARNFYDLHKVSLKDLSVEKLWDLERSPMNGDFFGLENMVYDEESDSFLVFTNLDGGSLLRIGRLDGSMEKMSFSLNNRLDKHIFYGNLFFSPEQKRYYVVIVVAPEVGDATMQIYELPAPAIPLSAFTQTDWTEEVRNERGGLLLWWIIAGIAVAALLLLILWRRRRGGVSHEEPEEAEEIERDDMPAVIADEPQLMESAEETPVIPDNENPTENADTTEPEPHPAPESDEPPIYDLTKGCIRLLGGFRVFDKDGNDITDSFTPTLKKLLVVIVLYTGNSPKGVSNKALTDFLWRDKDEDAAKNSRNVYLSRLRYAISPIGNTSLESDSGLRFIRFGEGTMCDYLEVLKLMEAGKADRIGPLLELLFNGVLLPNMEVDYIDPFKASFSGKVIDFLSSLLTDSSLPVKTRMRIADSLLLYDYVNEEALQTKCRILFSQGRIGEAKNSYLTFCKEYRKLMGEDYPRSFNDVIQTQ